MTASDNPGLARLEKSMHARMDVNVERAVAELDRALDSWVIWTDLVRQRRERVLGAHAGEANDPVLDDREYSAALAHADLISDARTLLRRYLKKGGKR